MDRSTDCRGDDGCPRPRPRASREQVRREQVRGEPVREHGVALELVIGRETIRVWLDDAGIHFRQDGARAEGHLPWSVAVAMSLIPPDLPRVGTIEAA